MKLNTVACGITLSLLGLASTSAFAEQEAKEGAYLGLFADYYWANWNNIEDKPEVSLGESLGLGLELGYRFDQQWAARLEVAAHDFGIKGTDQEKSATRFGIDALYHLDDSPFYGFAGVKKMDVYEDFNMVNLGAGARHYFNDDWAVSAEATWYEGLNRDYTDFAWKLGVNYFFGETAKSTTAAAKKVAPAQVAQTESKPLDSDNDGVYDVADNCANSNVSYAVDLNGCTVTQVREASLELLVNFPHDNSSVNAQYYNEITKVAEFLAKHSSNTVTLEGHTSARGAEAYNQKLSERRAKAVKAVLVNKHNIDAARIEVVGLGETQLLNTANTVKADADNRRVVAVKFIETVNVKRKKL